MYRAEETGKLFSTVNRIYYASFYAVSALLLTKGLSAPKHSGAIALFNREFVNRGILDKELGRFYNEIFEYRHKADYRDMTEFIKEDVGRWLNEAGDFIRRIREVVER